MTPKQEAALRQALEALNRNDYLGWQTNIHVREAIREALAEQSHCGDCGGFDPECPLAQPAQQQPLTDDEIDSMYLAMLNDEMEFDDPRDSLIAIVRAVEVAHGITG